ncbi:uncharacterized protein LOC123555097 isoform X2 [Mercenaria mercenaria]|uniref:uncharacterized protein LOC123555097 isoform X2 n=1 Tax=Mercenaria mercenaria TaxID=6596 RepID=UPI00234F62D2|nr:uncharacterized protein LOC123555097 isoform X2 [Mercenaria mercenaria]
MGSREKQDGGYSWIICFSLFIVEVLVDGIRFSYGLYFVEFLAEFKKTKAETAWIGGIMVGVSNIGGFGFGLVYLSGTVAISRYFLKKRALAIGISFCGSGIGLFVLPPLVRLLFEAYSWRGSLFILAGLMLNCCVCSVLYRPLHPAVTANEEYDVKGCDKSAANDNCVTSGNGQVALEHASPLLTNENRLITDKPVKERKPGSSSTPRRFAEMKKEQLQPLKEGNDFASQWSLTKAVLSQSIFGSNASFQYIIEKHNKTKNSVLSLQQPNTKAAEIEINIQNNRFKSSLIESMFPKELVTNINFIIMMIATFMLGVPSFVPFSMLPDYALTTDSSPSQAAWLLSAIGIGGTIGRMGAGILSDMPCVHRLTLNSVCFLTVGAVTVVAAILPKYEVLLSSSVIFGVFYGAIYVVQPVVLLEYIGEQYVSEFMGVLMSVYGVSGLIGNPLAGPVFAFIVNKVGYRKASLIGTLVGTAGLISSSYATEVYHLYLSYGALQGFGFGLVYLSGTVAISRYFLNKRALAIGISYCGSGIGLFVIPPLVRLLFEAYSWRGSLFILAGMMLNCCVCSVLYRPLHPANVTFNEEDDVKVCDKSAAIDNCVTSGNEHVALEQASPLLNNDNRLITDKPVKEGKLVSPSTPRSFAEMRKEQLQSLNEINDYASQRSLTKAVLSQSIFGSNASFQYIIEKHNKTKKSLLSLQKPNTKAAEIVINIQGNHFKCSLIESLFPKELVTNINFIIMMIATFLVGVPSFVPFSMLPDYALTTDSSPSQAAWLLSAIGIGGTIGRMGAGILSDMPCVHRLTLNSVCFLTVGAVTVVVAILPTYEVLLSSSVIFGLFYGAIYVVQPVVLLEYIGEQYVSEFMGVLMSVYGVSSLIGSPLAGLIFDITGSYRTTFLVAGVMFTLGGVVNFLVFCTKTSRNSRLQASQEQEVIQENVEYNVL